MPRFWQFRDFWYCTIDSWRRTRRVIGKAEHTPDGPNPRFIVTSLKRTRVAYDAREVAKMLRHRNPSVTARYVHLAEATQYRLQDRAAAKLLG